MIRRISPLLSLASCSFFLAPHKGDEVPSGSGATLKDQLSKAQSDLQGANAKLSDFESGKAKLEADLKAANDKAEAAEAAKTKLEADLKLSSDKVAKLESDLKLASDKTAKLESEAKTADDRAKEKAAAHGITPVATGNAAAAGNSKDAAALYAEYANLKGRAKSQFMTKHSEALSTYAEELDSLS